MVYEKDKVSRREFIQKAALASAVIAAGGKAPVAATKERPVLVKLSGPSVPVNLGDSVKKVLKPLGGLSRFVKAGQSVLIKPNLGFPTPPAQRATTDPFLVAEVAKAVIACGADRIVIADNPVRRPEACLRITGIKEALKGLDVHLVLPTSEKMYKEISIKKGKSLRKVRIFKEALECDVHIAMPVAKSHNAAGFTGTLKGMMGLILDRESFHSVYDLNQAIADLNTVLRPDLVILDAIKIMVSDGPAGPGEIVDCNTLLAGTDPVAVDAEAVRLAPLYGRKLKARQIKHLKLASNMDIGQLRLSEGQIVKLQG